MFVELKVLIACEYSGVVRNAFLAAGHDAWSCDLLPSEDGSNRHMIDDARNHIDEDWDMLVVAHPPCTRLCNSGVRWLHEPPAGRSREELWAELDDGASFFSDLWNCRIPHRAVENPTMHRYARERIVNYTKPQYVQPWWFGEPTFKAIGLWTHDLPPLEATDVLDPPAKGTADYRAWSWVHNAPPGPDRWKDRSRFFPGVAKAMAEQWGGHVMRRVASGHTKTGAIAA